MSDLTPRQRALIDEMLHSQEAEEYGFSQLAKHPKRALYFDGLLEAGLLSPKKNSSPIPAKQENTFYVPYWRALDYLAALAEEASDTGNVDLGKKVLQVVLAVSRGTGDERGPQDNFHTYRAFIEILAKLPETVVSDELIGEVKGWTFARFDHGLVISEIGAKLIPKLLEYPVERHGNQVLMLLDYVTQVKWKQVDGENVEPILADDHWLKRLLENHAVAAWRYIGQPVINLFRSRVREIFSKDEVSWLNRPAVEDHEQNHSWKASSNLVVEALRNVLLSAAETDQQIATAQLKDMYKNGSNIEKRIALYVINEKFERFGAQAFGYLDKGVLDNELLHESYNLLRNHFADFDQDVKARIFESVKEMSGEQEPADSYVRRLRMQRRWLGALVNQGYADADELFMSLVANPEVGSQPENPDFYSYMTSWSGPGPSEYTADEVVHFLAEGTLVEKLNTFKPSGDWRGPSTRALVDTFVHAIKSQPREFLSLGENVLKLKRPYQYGFLNAFSELWSSNVDLPDGLEWNKVWEILFNLIEKILDKEFWEELAEEPEDLTPTKNWIPSLVASLIKAGTRDDAKAFDPIYLPRSLQIVRTMLEGLPRSDEPPAPDQEPMHDAINDVRGGVIEALVNVALRSCRIADQAAGKVAHGEAWKQLAPTFDSELAAADGKNFEFSTLAANYCAHFHYLSPEWLEQNYKAIFCPANDESFKCAMSGLAYAKANKMLYRMLKGSGALDRALKSTDLHDLAREKILERVALAYLWGDEPLNSDVISGLFNAGREEDLSIVVSFFWSISEQNISPEHKKDVLAFWRLASEWALKQEPQHLVLLAKLATLASYIEKLDDADTALLASLAAFVNADHSSYYFAKELRRLVESYPAQVAKIAKAYFAANGPEHDFEGLWLTIATQLHVVGMDMDALELANTMRGQNGFQELYHQIRDA